MTDPATITKNTIELLRLFLDKYDSELEASEHGESPPEWSEWEDLISEIKVENINDTLNNFIRILVAYLRAQSITTATNNTVMLTLIEKMGEKLTNPSSTP